MSEEHKTEPGLRARCIACGELRGSRYRGGFRCAICETVWLPKPQAVAFCDGACRHCGGDSMSLRAIVREVAIYSCGGCSALIIAPTTTHLPFERESGSRVRLSPRPAPHR